jgi:hypothetical protein
MSQNNGKAKGKKKSNNKKPKLELHVAPRVGTKASREVVACLGDLQFTDVFDTSKASSREKFAARLRKKWDVGASDLDGIDELLAQAAEQADEEAEEAAKKGAAKAKGADASQKALEETPEEIKEAAEAFLSNPDLMDELAEDMERLGIVGERQLSKMLYLVMTSRKLKRPVAASVRATSSSGKSHLTHAVTSLMPDEDVCSATSMSPLSLYYAPPDSFRHKVIVVAERQHQGGGNEADVANATVPLRELISRGRIDRLVSLSADGEIRTKTVSQQGPVAYVDTSTQLEIFEEDATRLLSLATDESPEQTEAIMRFQARQAAGQGADEEEQEAIREKHRAAQRLLQKLRVRIPFAEKLKIPATAVVARRAFPQLLAVIAAVALLHQRRKEIHDGRIDADAEDYEIAYELVVPVLRRTFAPLSERAEQLLKVIRDKLQDEPMRVFTRPSAPNGSA